MFRTPWKRHTVELHPHIQTTHPPIHTYTLYIHHIYGQLAVCNLKTVVLLASLTSHKHIDTHTIHIQSICKQRIATHKHTLFAVHQEATPPVYYRGFFHFMLQPLHSDRAHAGGHSARPTRDCVPLERVMCGSCVVATDPMGFMRYCSQTWCCRALIYSLNLYVYIHRYKILSCIVFTSK